MKPEEAGSDLRVYQEPPLAGRWCQPYFNGAGKNLILAVGFFNILYPNNGGVS